MESVYTKFINILNDFVYIDFLTCMPCYFGLPKVKWFSIISGSAFK